MSDQCIWKPRVYPTKRVSTLFYTTSCSNREFARQDDALYCYNCGKPINIEPRRRRNEQPPKDQQ